MTKRTPAQRAAVLAVRSAAKALIADIDRWDYGTEFTAYFHLDRWVVVSPTFRSGCPLFKQASVRLPPPAA